MLSNALKDPKIELERHRMNHALKRVFRDYKPYIWAYPDTRKANKSYLKPRDIPPGKAAIILNRLNSFDSAEQLRSDIQQHTNQMILSKGDAQRILHSKTELGEFQDLRQVAIVLRIGAKKFDFIVHALSN
jgi:hypothetical protein